MRTTTMIVAVLVLAAMVQADVFNLGGVRDPLTGAWMGLASLETVPVGDAGNAGEQSGLAIFGDTTYYGAVPYEFSIGKYEVTAGQYTEFLNKVAKADAYGLYNANMWDTYGCKIQRSGFSGNYVYNVDSAWANRPVNCVSWGDAARFTNWLHNGQPMGPQNASTTEDGAYYLNGATSAEALMAVRRKPDARWAIPTKDEWYKAAYYKGGATNAEYWDYPTSSDTTPGRDMADVSGNNANFWTDSGPYPIDSGKYTTVVGEFQNSRSPYGTFDQGGNVLEWNEAILFYGVRRGMRGGSYGLDADIMQAANRVLDSAIPLDEDGCIGFRVSQIPPPHPGDINRDGQVSLLDYNIIKMNFGRIFPSGNHSGDGDVNGDLQVGLLDFNIVKAHFGHTAGDVGVTAVPEPATLSLLALGGLAVLRKRGK